MPKVDMSVALSEYLRNLADRLEKDQLCNGEVWEKLYEVGPAGPIDYSAGPRTDGGTDRWDGPIAANGDLYDRARSQWGDDAQLAKLAEEAAELSAVASRAQNGQADPDAFLEELVDARIMIEQFAHCYTPDRLEPFVEDGVGDLDRRLEDDPEIATDGGTDNTPVDIDPDELPQIATIDEDGAITMLPLEEAYPDPSLDRVVMKIEDNGTAPIDGQRDLEKLREAYWELGSWLRHQDAECDSDV